MSVKQLVILAIAIVALVFIVTLASQYLGGENKGSSTPDRTILAEYLTFPHRAHPPLDAAAGEPEFRWVQESQTPGHHDFWFQNDSGVPVHVGLSSKNCTCSTVEICVLPEERWKTLDEEPRKYLPEQDTTLSWKVLRPAPEDSKGVTVAAGAAGWVRLAWDGRKNPQLRATLWTNSDSGEGPEQELLVSPTFVRPILCYEESTLGQPNAQEKWLGKLEPGVNGHANFLCWSSTRSRFTLKPEPTKTRCVIVGEPVKLIEPECKKMSDALKIPVLCRYRVPVTVREQVDDTQLDLGLFRYRVGLTTDVGFLSVFVSGEVEGPVSVVTPDNRSQVDIGKFPAREDMDFVVNLVAGDANLKMKLDRGPEERSPFFQAREPEEIKETVGKRWRIEVKIPAGSVEGHFPTSDRPGYTPDDCSIYLAIYRTEAPASRTDKPWRRIRVPLKGEATR